MSTAVNADQDLVITTHETGKTCNTEAEKGQCYNSIAKNIFMQHSFLKPFLGVSVQLTFGKQIDACALIPPCGKLLQKCPQMDSVMAFTRTHACR